MKEIKAFVHRNRVADIVHALRNAGYYSGACNLSVVDVVGTLQALDTQEKSFSLELGEEVINEVKLELVCEDERADEVVRIIRENGRTGQKIAGWVYVIDIGAAYSIDTD
ncbi:MAG: P-II family nitrogen regulator [Thiogranum sp.]|nr:P-II family nitrogen regulator [Thiogranum sp.]